MLSSRPYLLRAVHEWIVDSDCTPHLLIDAEFPGLEVPDLARKGDKVVLNVSPAAVRDLIIDSELISFVARFGGVSRAVSVPVNAVQAVYARENGRGMMFPEEDDLDAAETDSGDSDGPEDEPIRGKRPNLKIVK
jgi:stringent starvation protein B